MNSTVCPGLDLPAVLPRMTSANSAWTDSIPKEALLNNAVVGASSDVVLIESTKMCISAKHSGATSNRLPIKRTQAPRIIICFPRSGQCRVKLRHFLPDRISDAERSVRFMRMQRECTPRDDLLVMREQDLPED